MAHVDPHPALGSDPPSEPLLWTAATITGAAAALVTLVVAFGLRLTDGQEKAILGVVAVLAPIVLGVVARQRVYSPATVKRLLSVRRP
jgi:hypothetical protein